MKSLIIIVGVIILVGIFPSQSTKVAVFSINGISTIWKSVAHGIHSVTQSTKVTTGVTKAI